MRRAIVLVLDSFGIGSAPDADKFGDQGADTLGHIAAANQPDLMVHSESFGGLAPNNAVPIRTMVLPSVTASSKSFVIPIESVSKISGAG